MQQDITTVGIDLAKSVFQVHAINADGEVLVRRQLRRAEVLRFFSSLPPCLVGMEACASAHHWGRELLALGHDVRLMPPAYVKPYVKRGKTDAADAEAICEAVTRPTMRFVAVKSVEFSDAQRAFALKQGDDGHLNLTIIIVTHSVQAASVSVDRSHIVSRHRVQGTVIRSCELCPTMSILLHKFSSWHVPWNVFHRS